MNRSARRMLPPLAANLWFAAGMTTIAALLLAGCNPSTPSDPGGSPSDGGSGSAAIVFEESSGSAGISFQHTDGSSGRYFIVETLASGVILFDYDLDGDLDIYFVNGRPLPPTPEGDSAATNALYENDGKARFRDVTQERGVPGTRFGTGGAAADYDGDGDLDLYVCQYGSNVLYRNEGKEKGWKFTDVTAAAKVDDTRFSAGASFVDIDRDGDLDLYVTNYCAVNFETDKPCETNGYKTYCAPSQYQPAGDSLFKNNGDGTFLSITDASGIGKLRGRGMGVVSADFDQDGWQDIYVANDGSANFLLLNQKNDSFGDQGLTAGVAYSAHGDEQGSMGVDTADFNQDGRLDVIVTNYQKQLNALYTAHTDAFYLDLAMKQGLGETCLPMVSWGTKFFDGDNDGRLDLFIANGHLEDQIDKFDQSSVYRQRNQLFWNAGSHRLQDITRNAGSGLAERFSSRGAAFGDLDRDGDIDIVVSNSRARPSLLLNQASGKNHWIQLALRGERNIFAIGASVSLSTPTGTQTSVVAAGASYISQNDLTLHFGLGSSDSPVSAEVRWPRGTTETFQDLAPDRLHTLVEGQGAK